MAADVACAESADVACASSVDVVCVGSADVVCTASLVAVVDVVAWALVDVAVSCELDVVVVSGVAVDTVAAGGRLSTPSSARAGHAGVNDHTSESDASARSSTCAFVFGFLSMASPVWRVRALAVFGKTMTLWHLLETEGMQSTFPAV